VNDFRVVCFGVSHHKSNIEVRERVRFALFDGRELLSSNRRNGGNGSGTGLLLPAIREMVLVSTCNRVELYACVDADTPSTKRLLFDLVTEATSGARRRAGFEPGYDGFTRELIDDITMYYEGDEAIQHLFSVACGLDSMVLGETQILTQINEAYETARDTGLAGPVLSAVFRAAHRAGKKARTLTEISSNASSISTAAVSLLKECVDDLGEKEITVIGLGEMGQLALKTLFARGARRLRIINRTVERAAALAAHVTLHAPAEVIVHGLDDIPEALEATDAVIAVTGALEWVVDADVVRRVMDRRGERELVIVDMGAPRNVEPAAGQVNGVRLFDTDDIAAIKDRGLAARRNEIPKVEAIIKDEMKRLEVSLRRVEAQPLIAELRRKADAIRQRELERTYRKLGSPDPETWSHVERLASALVNKLYHHPTSALKENAGLGNADEYATTIRELFGLSSIGRDGSDES
jgi:glutamyl-tRNA reductase